MESRLHLIPRYRQHLARIPIEGHPVWVDDDQFDIRYRDLHDLVLLIRQSFDELCEAAGLFPEEVPALPAIEKNCAEAGDAMGA